MVAAHGNTPEEVPEVPIVRVGQEAAFEWKAEEIMIDASKLEGTELDAAVALAEGLKDAGQFFDRLVHASSGAIRWATIRKDSWRPSTDWSQGGPIIEREKIDISAPDPFDEDQRWFALLWRGRDAATVSAKFNTRGETPLVAAMRAFVASRA